MRRAMETVVDYRAIVLPYHSVAKYTFNMKKDFLVFTLLGLFVIQTSFAKTLHKHIQPITISLNGHDNVGKTTQMSLLPLDGNVDHRTSIHFYDQNIQDMVNKNIFDIWWRKSNDKDFVIAIFNALNKRSKIKTCKESVVFDRGVRMFDAVCVARIAQKNKISLEEAERKYLKIKSGIKPSISKEDFAILLVQGSSLKDSIKISLEREKRKPDQIYKEYQTLLQKYLLVQIKNGVYDVVIQCDSLSPVQIQNKIRTEIRLKFPKLRSFVPFFVLPNEENHILLNANYLLDYKLSIPKYIKIGMEHRLLYQLNKFLRSHYWVSSFHLCGISEDLRKKLSFLLGYEVPFVKCIEKKIANKPNIIAFGGLSESGKSSFASMICKKYKNRSIRLKIDFLLTDVDPLIYKRNSFEQAKLLVGHLQRIIKYHPWLDIITIESLHSLKSTRSLKDIMGSDLTIVYLDVPLKTRDYRSSETLQEILKKDQVKKSRGANLIKSLADIIYFNTNNDLEYSFNMFLHTLLKEKPSRNGLLKLEE